MKYSQLTNNLLQFMEGEVVTGTFGSGRVASIHEAQMVTSNLEQCVRDGLIPVIFSRHGCYWQTVNQLKRVVQ